MFKKLFALSASACFVFLPAHADTPASFCHDDDSMIVDDAQTCIETDSLDNLIADYEAVLAETDPFLYSDENSVGQTKILPDVSPETDKLFDQKFMELAVRHRSLASKPMNDNDRLNYDILGFELAQRARLAPFDESRLPFTNDGGFFIDPIYVLRRIQFNSVADYENYVARLSGFQRFFGQHKTNMRRGIKTGYTAAADVMPSVMENIRQLQETPIDEHPFFEPFTNIPESFSEADKARVAEMGRAVMENVVIPAYTDLLDFMQSEYLPHARSSIGIGTTPTGRAHYTSLVRYYTTLDVTPDEMHTIGLNEVKRIREEMDDIIQSVEFEGSFEDFLNFLRTNPQFYAASSEQLLKEAAWITKKIDGKMPKYFKTLPRLPYGVIPVPDTLAASYTTGRYWPGNLKQKLAGNFVVNTHDLSQRPLYNLPALTLHEGVPGHHHQFSLSMELSDLPDFRRNLYISAFGEGWGLYTEKLGVEMGIYETPYEHFGRLTYEMWRACRLVVDTGIHWKGWTREQAEKCFYENSALSPHNIKNEVDRYISWPGQALAYKTGELKILELRQHAQNILGEQFSLPEFHDALLLNGSLPLDILDARIHFWISQQPKPSTSPTQ